MYKFSRLVLCATLTLILLVIELVLTHFTHCISLLAVANQSMYNLLSLVISASTIVLCHNKSPAISLRSTFSWKRLEVVGSLSSLVFLGSLFFGTVVEGLQTITHSGHLDVMHNPLGVFLLAVGHFFIWIAIFSLIGGYSRQQIKSTIIPKQKRDNLLENSHEQDHQHHHHHSDHHDDNHSHSSPKGVHPTFKQFIKESKYVDIFRDLASCFALMGTSLVVYFVDEDLHPNVVKFVDPIVAIVSIIAVILASVPIIKRSCHILLQTIPDHLDKDGILDELRTTFKADILGIHEFHLWCLVPPTTFATLHVIFKDEKTFLRVNSSMTDLLKKRGVQNITLQPEFLPQGIEEDMKEEEISRLTEDRSKCLFDCKTEFCLQKRCCINPPDKKSAESL